MNSEYKVIWNEPIMQELGDLVLRLMEQGRNPAGVVKAIAAAEATLSSEPHEAGESRDHNNRVLIESPLSVTFRVVDTEKTVYILSAHYYPPKSTD